MTCVSGVVPGNLSTKVGSSHKDRATNIWALPSRAKGTPWEPHLLTGARCPLSSWPTASSRTGCSLGSPPEVLIPSGPLSKLCPLPGKLFSGPSLVGSFSPPEVFVCSFNVSADKLSAPSGQSSYLLPSLCTHGAQGFLSPAAQLTQNALGREETAGPQLCGTFCSCVTVSRPIFSWASISSSLKYDENSPLGALEDSGRDNEPVPSLLCQATVSSESCKRDQHNSFLVSDLVTK